MKFNCSHATDFQSVDAVQAVWVGQWKTRRCDDSNRTSKGRIATFFV